jgi:hypothetical protein
VKQSPSPQHHSPAPLRSAPREIQLSWAAVSAATRRKDAKASASRRQYPNIGWPLIADPGTDAIDD